jgi:hypothetical protein
MPERTTAKAPKRPPKRRRAAPVVAEPPGGSGGDLRAETMTARDTRMVEKAIRQRWDIPEATRRRLPEVLAGIIDREDASDRNRIAAARALVDADRANIAAESGGGAPAARQSITLIEVRVGEARPAEPLTVTALPPIEVSECARPDAD